MTGRLGSRVARLEGNGESFSVVVDERDLSEAERRKVAEDHRQAHGLAPDALVLVISGDDAGL